jgi:actin cytoskeleton-regulatory complex protein SLA1
MTGKFEHGQIDLDHTKSEAQFLSLSDGQIGLHKLNGVKLSVPLSKLSIDDVQFVERWTGRETSPPPKPLPYSEKKKIDYDWHVFFLDSGVDYITCQRYAIAFKRDQMDESILPNIKYYEHYACEREIFRES